MGIFGRLFGKKKDSKDENELTCEEFKELLAKLIQWRKTRKILQIIEEHKIHAVLIGDYFDKNFDNIPENIRNEVLIKLAETKDKNIIPFVVIMMFYHVEGIPNPVRKKLVLISRTWPEYSDMFTYGRNPGGFINIG